MKKRFVLISFFVLLSVLIGITFSSIKKGHSASLSLNDLSKQFLQENENFQHLIESLTFDIKKDEIIIHAKITDEFRKLHTSEQFGTLSYYAKYVRHYLRNQKEIQRYQATDINIISNSNNNSFRLSNKIPDKKVIVVSESNLYLNNKRVLGSKEFKIKVEQYIYKNPQIVDSDVEVIRYAMDLFNKLTLGGKYYDHKKDSNVILNLTTDKFGITEQEFVKIYKKYFYLFE